METTGSGERTLQQVLEEGPFAYGVELVSTRGFVADGAPPKPAELGLAIAQDKRLGWLSITDNPGGHPMLSADSIARALRPRAVRLVMHLSCKDLNRNGLESRIWQYAGDGLDNILALTGDYPVEGHRGLPEPAFDLDSVSLIDMLSAFNRGLEFTGPGGRPLKVPPTRFYVGCAVSPFKRHQAELVPQYRKLLSKIRCGAQWVLPQLGYDMRKFHEIKLVLDQAGVRVPLIGNVYLLNKTVAGMFQRDEIAGCVVSDELKALIDKYSAGPDKGRAFCRELAAKQVAVFKGLGFAAAYLGGIMKAETFSEILDLADTFAPDDWRQFAKDIQFAQPDEFYMFERNAATGLGQADRLNPALAKRLRVPESLAGYRLSRLVHALVFTAGRPGFAMMQRFYRRVDRKEKSLIGRAMYAIERLGKFIGYGCHDCGDCSLPDCAYQCPLSACSKNQRNGPCGGSRDGMCELKDKRCMWVRAYERLKHFVENDQMLQGPPIYYNASLRDTSSWANTFLLRDHHAEATRQALDAAKKKA